MQVAAADRKDRGRIGAVPGPVRLIPNDEDPISIAGSHGYLGRLELTSASNGLVLSDRLPLEEYLLGLNEVPTTWPAEALKAQAVAARTYALWTLAQGPGGDASVYGFDICASVQCQVFSGADVVNSLTGVRWKTAVESTRGVAILYDGEPILARYHSTSGGLTLNNEWVFPEEGPFPYLVSVESPTEQGSPLFRWNVDIRLDRLTKLLQNAGWWTHGHVTNAYSVDSRSGLHYPDVIFKGKKGPTEGGADNPHPSVGMTAEEFRDAIRDLAPELYPNLYPSPSDTASGRLPETLPSNRISMFTRGDHAIIVGRGWGHGVGMSQWGAHGLALQGAGYRDILSHYYTGVAIDQFSEPGPIEVGLNWGLSTVTASGSFRIVDGEGRTIVPHALGTWNFRWPGTGAVSVEPPKGFGLPLSVGIVDFPERIEAGVRTSLAVALSKPARLSARTSPKAPSSEAVLKEAGRKKIAWRAPSEPGTYRVRVLADSGDKKLLSRPVRIEVFSDEGASPRPPVGTDLVRTDDSMLWAAVGAGVALLVLIVLVTVSRRRRTQGSEGPPSKLMP
jgi:stage II sporulation protein D